MNPLNRMNPGFRKKDVMSIIGTHVESERDFARDLDDTLTIIQPNETVSCTKGAACTGALTCKGQHWRGDAVSAYPPKLAANALYGKRDQAIEHPVTADEAVKIIQHAYTGNGYGVAINPLLEEPETIDEHVALIRARGASLERWTRKHEDIATNGPIIRELIARMEGNLQALRTLVKDIEKAESE